MIHIDMTEEEFKDTILGIGEEINNQEALDIFLLLQNKNKLKGVSE